MHGQSSPHGGRAPPPQTNYLGRRGRREWTKSPLGESSSMPVRGKTWKDTDEVAGGGRDGESRTGGPRPRPQPPQDGNAPIRHATIRHATPCHATCRDVSRRSKRKTRRGKPPGWRREKKGSVMGSGRGTSSVAFAADISDITSRSLEKSYDILKVSCKFRGLSFIRPNAAALWPPRNAFSRPPCVWTAPPRTAQAPPRRPREVSSRRSGTALEPERPSQAVRSPMDEGCVPARSPR